MASLVGVLTLAAWISGDAGVPPAIPACEPNERYDTPSQQPAHHHRVAASDYRGRRAAQLLARFGPPTCRGRDKWRYLYPQGCTEWRTVVTLWFSRGKVVRVNVVEHYTGMECR